jgi:hypothetical protein
MHQINSQCLCITQLQLSELELYEATLRQCLCITYYDESAQSPECHEDGISSVGNPYGQ